MSSISTDDVKKLAVLSALTLDEDAVETMRSDLEQVLGYVEQLGEIDTDGVEPTYQVNGLETVTRTDEVIDYGVGTNELLHNTPKHTNGTIEVPRVMQ